MTCRSSGLSRRTKSKSMVAERLRLAFSCPVFRLANVQSFQINEARGSSAASLNVGSAYVVCNTVHPRPQTAAPVKLSHTAPKLKMYFLKQISLLVAICFVSTGETPDSRSGTLQQPRHKKCSVGQEDPWASFLGASRFR